jgi:putative flavoprotein involved in K+ transport
MSRCLSDLGLDHAVLERGRIGERWRTERWDSLRLLTPNWQSRLPGFRYTGPDPHGYMTATEVVGYFEQYARSFRAPVENGTAVLGVSEAFGGYHVTTDRDTWAAKAVVVATGYCDIPAIPAVARAIAPGVRQLVPAEYRRPQDLDEGGVLVIGASATGVQIADELLGAGRDVTIAAGHHTRIPRCYRGRDIMWWLDRSGLLDVAAGDVYDIEVSRRQPSFQLVGRPDHRSIDLATLRARGARVVGRVASAEGTRVWFDDDLVATTAASDAKLAMLLKRLDDFAGAARQEGRFGDPEPFQPLWPEFMDAPLTIDLRAERIATVVWATGYRRHYPWLQVPVVDRRGDIAHRGGFTASPGLYVLGMQFQRRRNSNFIDGVGKDARVLAAALAEHLGHRHQAIA